MTLYTCILLFLFLHVIFLPNLPLVVHFYMILHLLLIIAVQKVHGTDYYVINDKQSKNTLPKGAPMLQYD